MEGNFVIKDYQNKGERFKLIEQIQVMIKKKRNIIPTEFLLDLKSKLEQMKKDE